MESFGLPAYLPEWRGAESATAASDMPMVRQRARELVDLVLAEDTRYLDALPETIESAIVTPLSILSHALGQGSDVGFQPRPTAQRRRRHQAPHAARRKGPFPHIMRPILTHEHPNPQLTIRSPDLVRPLTAGDERLAVTALP
nr:hypothetical protein GCM10020063_057630 [Dactylosporangium thailandense]